MDLGNFSLSLSVKDLGASKAFYEKLGFAVIAGELTHNYLILANGPVKVGLFQGMFTGNILTFNPGWGPGGEPLAAFTDVREIQARLREQGVPIVTPADEASTGPAHVLIADPDGNVIMFDQHVPRPGSDD
ncbi:MAG: VOC family protein [Myxococcales bacterium]|nr:VOC family protein [Myxococcales bacterium]